MFRMYVNPLRSLLPLPGTEVPDVQTDSLLKVLLQNEDTNGTLHCYTGLCSKPNSVRCRFSSVSRRAIQQSTGSDPVHEFDGVRIVAVGRSCRRGSHQFGNTITSNKHTRKSFIQGEENIASRKRFHRIQPSVSGQRSELPHTATQVRDLRVACTLITSRHSQLGPKRSSSEASRHR